MAKKRGRARPRAGGGGRAGLLTRAALAGELGVAPNRVNKWVADGMPVAIAGSRGHSAFYSLGDCKAWLAARANRSAGDPNEGLSLGAARARLAKAQAEKWERENLVRAGQLVERDLVVREGQAFVRATQARLLSIPRQCVMRGIVPREQEPALRALIIEALRELARWKSIDDTEREGARPPEASPSA